MEILFPKKKFDLLYYYSQITRNPKVQKFLENKPIATKIWIPGKPGSIGFFLRRGSKDEPLKIKELASPQINDDFLELRTEMKRDDAIKQKNKLSKIQKKVWLYFPPNKCVDFFYACNGEGQGRKLDRIFIDIDRENLSSEKAQQVAIELTKVMKNDQELKKLIPYKLVILWTGSSFHIYLMLASVLTLDFYNKYFAYTKNEPLASFIGRWAKEIKSRTNIKVSGGHEKLQDTIVLDPSGTPSGKLARIPFSLHFIKPADQKEKSIDGVCVPISEEMLRDPKLISKLQALKPEQVLKELNKWAENL
jgi:hypothetical protein